jgi:serine/threonine protein phosphatase PrpC
LKTKKILSKFSFHKRIKKVVLTSKPGKESIEDTKNKINQDNFFISKFPKYNMNYIGVCDGHGNYGHLVSEFIKTNPNALPAEIINILIKTSNEKNLTEYINGIPQYYLTLMAAQELDNNNPSHDYITGSIFVSVPSIFSSCEAYLNMVKNGEIAKEDADVDRFHLITVEDNDAETPKTVNVLVL